MPIFVVLVFLMVKDLFYIFREIHRKLYP